MPDRVIREAINRSESLARVSLGAELTFRALLLVADDEGRIDRRPRLLLGAAFPAREEVSEAQLEAWIDELVEEGCLRAYEVEGRRYLDFPSWGKHMPKRRHEKPSPLPPCPDGPALPPATSPSSECVYFVEAHPGGPIKIGWTSNLESRLQALRLKQPELRLLATQPGWTRALEKRLHRQFASDRREGEWFERSAALRKYIQESAQPADGPWAAHEQPTDSPHAVGAPAGIGVGVGVGEGGCGGESSDPPGGHDPPPTALASGSRARGENPAKRAAGEMWEACVAEAKAHGRDWSRLKGQYEKHAPARLRDRIYADLDPLDLTVGAIRGYVALRADYARMLEYLRPQTIFGPQKHASYVTAWLERKRHHDVERYFAELRARERGRMEVVKRRETEAGRRGFAELYVEVGTGD